MNDLCFIYFMQIKILIIINVNMLNVCKACVILRLDSWASWAVPLLKPQCALSFAVS